MMLCFFRTKSKVSFPQNWSFLEGRTPLERGEADICELEGSGGAEGGLPPGIRALTNVTWTPILGQF